MQILRMAAITTAVFSAAVTAGNPADGYVASDYTLKPIQNTALYKSPLNAVVEVRLSESVQTIRQALEELLRGSGYRFSESAERPEARSALMYFLDGPLPDIQRTIGPTSLSQALDMIAGNVWKPQVNELRRSVSLVLSNPTLIPARPVGVQHHADQAAYSHPASSSMLRVPFADGSASLSQDAKLQLDRVARFDNGRQIRINLTGYSHNPQGSGNKDLARKRAQAARSYLQSQGVNATYQIDSSIKNRAARKRTDVVVKVSLGTDVQSTAQPVQAKTIRIRPGLASKQFQSAMEQIGYQGRTIWSASDQWIKTATSFRAVSREVLIRHLAQALDVCVIESSLNHTLDIRNAGGCDNE